MPDKIPHLRFAIVAPVGRDGELISAFLHAAGYGAMRFDSIREIELLDSADLLGLVLTDEAFGDDGGIACLRRIVEAQPVWSDLPVMLLTSDSLAARSAKPAAKLRMEIRNLFLLDRPVRKELLLSAIQVAFGSRLKQIEVRDVTDRQVRTDEALRNTERLAMSGQLAATMVHEVNNPLEAIGNLLYLVENSSTVGEARHFSKLASQELVRISDIISQTLRYHRAPAAPALVDVSEIANSALALFQGKFRDRHIELLVETPKMIAYCSAGEIRQALVNLIGNALDAMPQGGALQVHVSGVSLGDLHYARVTVADSGGGIREEIRSSLFTQFFTTKGSRGTGLGLWLTRDIVQRNFGKLRFRSRTRKPSGTVFSILLPAAPPRDIAEDARHVTHSRQEAAA
ncbi:MAG TPA: ATP-binding protein [Terracidiphilus sp.]|jgi:signal transduction histidine kinase|nr:ATP-binding protein [Terracidiphilus sp.]